MKKEILISVGILLLIVIGIFFIKEYEKESSTNSLYSLLEEPLPPFILEDIDGNTINSEELKGKAVVVNLWFTGCKPCIDEIPFLNKIKRENEGEVVFLAITFNDPETIEKFIKKYPFDFTQIPSAEDYVEQVSTIFPTTLFVDSKGIVKHIALGVPKVPSGEMEAALEEKFSKGISLIL